MKTKYLALTTCAMLLYGAAATADTYIVGSKGEAEFELGGEYDTYDIGLGFKLSDFVSLELSYENFDDESFFEGSDFIQTSLDGYNVELVGELPLNDSISLYASAGYLFWEFDERVRGASSGYRAVYDSSDMNFGAGLLLKIFEELDLKIGYTDYEFDDIDSSADNVSLGLKYTF